MNIRQGLASATFFSDFTIDRVQELCNDILTTSSDSDE